MLILPILYQDVACFERSVDICAVLVGELHSHFHLEVVCGVVVETRHLGLFDWNHEFALQRKLHQTINYQEKVRTVKQIELLAVD